ncbi:MAG: hypothetical protein JO251_03515 [Verrucomicrobia bacterium]|jgi:hypothetical protein|nr:hypothetical protein [Verrucomicrobiota bacterium]
MSTLAEIEAALDRLSHPEQEILLEHLARKLGLQNPVLPEDPSCRDRALQRVLDDIRAEDC